MICNPVCKGLDPPLGLEDGCLLWIANFDTPITGATTVLIFLKSHLTSMYSLKIRLSLNNPWVLFTDMVLLQLVYCIACSINQPISIQLV